MQVWQIILLVLAIIIVLFIILFLIVGHVFFKGSLCRKEIKETSDSDTNLDKTVKLLSDKEFSDSKKYEEVFIISNDGLKLAAYFLRSKDKNHKYVIFLHGYFGTVLCEWSTLIHEYYDAGFNIYSIHERANWDSEGKYFTMGPKEKEDLLLWINYVVKQDAQAQILVFGHSMGAHIALLAMGENLPSNVKCCIADCGYASLDDQFIQTAKNLMHLKGAKFLIRMVEVYCHIFHHMHFNETTVKALKRCKTPVCLIHGTGDKFVPYYNLDLNYNAIPKDIYKEKHSFKDAAHCSSESQDPTRFYKIVFDFTKKYIK